MEDETEEEKSFWEQVKEMQEEHQNTGVSEELLQEVSEKRAAGARSDTVTAARLCGEEQFFHNVIPFLEEGEQPHYLFPLTNGLTADNALVIESGAEERVLLSNTDGGSVMISDLSIRIVSSKGEWSIPFDSISSVDFVGHPALHIQTTGRTYYIKIAGTFFDEEETVSEAATHIRQIQRESREDPSTEKEPLDKLERLSELHDKGVLADEEFEEKKADLLDDI